MLFHLLGPDDFRNENGNFKIVQYEGKWGRSWNYENLYSQRIVRQKKLGQ